MAAIQITMDNFEQEVLKSDKPVLVDFWSEGCAPCRMLLPVIEQLAEEVTNAKICKVNVDEQMQLAMKYRVMRIPTLMVFKDGEAVQTEIGFQSKEKLLEMLNV